MADGPGSRTLGILGGIVVVVVVGLLLVPDLAAIGEAVVGLSLLASLGFWMGSYVVVTLVLGGVMVETAPAYTRSVMDAVQEETTSSLLKGVGWLIALVPVLVLSFLPATLFSELAIIAVVFMVSVAVLVLVGQSIVFVLAGTVLLGDEPADVDLRRALLVGSGVAGLALAVPGLNNLVNFLAVSTGFGAMMLLRGN